MLNEPLWSESDGDIKSSRFQSIQDGHSAEVFFSDKKGKMANIMFEILDGFSLVWVLMNRHSKSTFLQVT